MLGVNGGASQVNVGPASSIAQNQNQPTIRVINGHSGGIDFDGGTTVTNGDGLQFDDADGNYNFGGTNQLNGGDAGIDILGNSDGTFTFSGTTSITNPTGDAFNVTGDGTNNPSIAYDGGITNNAGDAVEITNTAGGANAITFQTGTVTDTGAGTGVFLNNVDQDVNFNGTTTLGANEGIDILGGTGTFTFTDTDITNPTGAAGLDVNGGSSQVNFGPASSIAQNQNQAAISVANGHTGGVDFDGGVTASNGTGLQFNNADGNYSADGTTALNGGDAGIDILGGSAGTFTFTDTTITDPTGVALHVDSSSPTVKYNSGGIVQNNAAPAVFVSFNNGGTIDINVGVTANTATAPAISLTANPAATINFDGGLNIDTTTGVGLNATGGGTVNVTPTAGDESINATGGQAINLDGVTIGISFDSIGSTNPGANEGIDIDSLGAGSTFTVDDGNFATDDVTISGTNAGVAGIDIDDSQGTFTFTIDLDNTGGDAINLQNNDTTAVNIQGGTIDGVLNNNDGINSTNTSGVSIGTLAPSSVFFGDTTAISGDGIEIVNNDAVSRTVTIQNNNIGLVNATDRGVFIDASGTGRLTANVQANAVNATNQTILTTDGGTPARWSWTWGTAC